MNVTKFAFCLILAFAQAGYCAFTTKDRVFQNMAFAGATGALYGFSRPDHQNTYATMYGGLATAVAAAITLYYINPDEKSEKYALENKRLKLALDQFQNPKVLFETPGTFNSKIPEKYRKLIQPGEWRISEIDQWSEEGENRIIHQDKIMELVPPTLIPNTNGGN